MPFGEGDVLIIVHRLSPKSAYHTTLPQSIINELTRTVDFAGMYKNTFMHKVGFKVCLHLTCHINEPPERKGMLAKLLLLPIQKDFTEYSTFVKYSE